MTDVLDLIRFYPLWQAKLERHANSLADAKPWVTFAATKVLEKFLQQCEAPRVFEFGSGGSTLFFLNQGVQVSSVEHDETWFSAVSDRIPAALKSRWLGRLCAPELGNPGSAQDSAENPTSYLSSAADYFGMRFVDYAQAIDAFPDRYFDLVLIDGRARPSCLMHAKSKVRAGGLLVLDNSERLHYQAARRTIDVTGSWDCSEYGGPGPYNRYFWDTTIWKRRTD